MGLAAIALVSTAPPLDAMAYRPFASSDASVAPRSELVLELGPLAYLREAGRSCLAPSLAAAWGIADDWEVGVDAPHFVHLGVDIRLPVVRVEDLRVLAKHLLRSGSLQDGEGISVAMELGGFRAISGGASGAETALIASRRWHSLTAHLNGALAWDGADGLATFAGLVLEPHDAWSVRPVTELFVATERGSPASLSALAGAIWRLDPRVQLDAAVRATRTGAVTTVEVGVGVTLAVGVGFPR